MKKILLPVIAFAAAVVFNFCGKPNPVITIKTETGDIAVEIFVTAAPLTSKNFLRYVDDGKFTGSSFYRTVTMANQPNNDVKIEVIQGGLKFDEDMYEPIAHENTKVTGVRHLDGTISMARNKPGTATSEFFICVGDQPELDYGGNRNPDMQGFAAFGKVISGMDIVRKIQNSPAEGQKLTPEIKIIGIERNGAK